METDGKADKIPAAKRTNGEDMDTSALPPPSVNHTTLEFQISVSSTVNLVSPHSSSAAPTSSPSGSLETDDEEDGPQDFQVICCLQTIVFKLSVCFVAGFIFGTALEKGRGTFNRIRFMVIERSHWAWVGGTF